MIIPVYDEVARRSGSYASASVSGGGVKAIKITGNDAPKAVIAILGSVDGISFSPLQDNGQDIVYEADGIYNIYGFRGSIQFQTDDPISTNLRIQVS
jgi:hypothetical protein